MERGFLKAKLILRNEGGMSLVMVMLILVLASVLTFSIMGTATNNLTQSSGEQESQSAYYIAEGGATEVLAQLDAKAKSLEAGSTSLTNFYTAFESGLSTPRTINSFSKNSGDQPIATVKVEKINSENPRQYRIVSTGKIGSRERQVSTIFTVNFSKGSSFTLPADLSLYTEERIELVGGAQIIGSVGTNLKTSGSIRLDGGAGISKQILVPVGSSENPITAPQDLLNTHKSKVGKFTESLVPHKLPAFPVFPTYATLANVTVGDQYNPFKVIDNGNLNITQWQTKSFELNLNSNVSFKDINVDQNNTLTINLGSHNREIVVDNLNLMNGNIHINGTGKLTVYVKNNMAFGNGGFNRNGNKAQLEIFFKGTALNVQKKHIQIASDMLINGSLYAENANLTFTGGGGFLGHVLSGGDSVTISGGARVGDSVILAPFANVRLMAGGRMQGAIISKSYYADGGTELRYVPINHSSIPLIAGIGGSAQTINFNAQAFRES